MRKRIGIGVSALQRETALPFSEQDRLVLNLPFSQLLERTPSRPGPSCNGTDSPAEWSPAQAGGGNQAIRLPALSCLTMHSSMTAQIHIAQPR